MQIDGKTQLAGLIGWPVSHSFSPAMHNAAANALGINSVYVTMPVQPQHLPAAIRGIPALGFKGVNVTVPHKQAVMPFLDSIEKGARIICAVNTILVHTNKEASQGWQLEGHNTDWLGFLADLKALHEEVDGRDCLVLGAGGSARAIVYALASSGANVNLLARRIAQAEQLAADFSGVAGVEAGSLGALPEIVSDLYQPLIVNTTPVGMSPHIGDSVWPNKVSLPVGSLVYDLVYNPLQTRLMQQAAHAGCRSSNGLGMLLHQGALAFELWHGQKPSIEVMKEALLSEKG